MVLNWFIKRFRKGRDLNQPSPLLEEIHSRFSFLFDHYGFQVLEDYFPDIMGSCVVTMESKDVRIKFVNDRGQKWIELGNSAEPDKWFGWDFVTDYLNDREPLVEEIDIDKPLAEMELPENLESVYPEIKKLFGNTRYPETQRQLEEMMELYKHKRKEKFREYTEKRLRKNQN